MSPRRVLITGASKGIGRAVADRLAAAGDIPIGLARTRPEDFPGEFYEVDLADRDATAEALEKIVASGRIDAVVNNVGFARFARIGSIELDHLFDTYDMNVRTAVQVVQAALPGMLAAGWGRIVNVTSLTTLGTPERTPYAAAKAALEACTRIWANELPRLASRSTRSRRGLPKPRCTASAARSGPSAKPGSWKPFRCAGLAHRGRSRMRSAPCWMRTPATSPVRSFGPMAAGASRHDHSGGALHRPTGGSVGGALAAARRRGRHLRGGRGAHDAAGGVLPRDTK